jgi:hypothetical protein
MCYFYMQLLSGNIPITSSAKIAFYFLMCKKYNRKLLLQKLFFIITKKE